MNGTRRKCWTVLAAFLVLAGCEEPEPIRSLSDLDARFREILKDNPEIPGLVATLFRNDRVLWRWEHGVRDLDTGAPMATNTIMNVGSVTKTLTAAAVIKLASEGLVDLDTDVSAYLGFDLENPNHPGTPITIRQLLLHRSSIADSDSYADSYQCGDPKESMDDWLKAYFDDDRAFHDWRPGSEVDRDDGYSNVAYGVIGHAIEGASGQPYDAFLQETFFGPLGMADTGFLIRSIDERRHATPYSDPGDLGLLGEQALRKPGAASREDHLPHCLYSFGTPTDGLMRTTLADLTKLLRLFLDEPQLTSIDGESWWNQGEGFIHHGGGDPGIRSYVVLAHTTKTGAALMYNYGGNGHPIEPLMDAMFEAAEALAASP